MDEKTRMRALKTNITKQEQLLHYLSSRGDPEASKQAEGISDRLAAMQTELASLSRQAGADEQTAADGAQAIISTKAPSRPAAPPEERLRLLRTGMARSMEPMLAALSEQRRALFAAEVAALAQRLAEAKPDPATLEPLEEAARDLRRRINVMRVLDVQARAMSANVRDQFRELQQTIPASGINKSMQIGLQMVEKDVERLTYDAETATSAESLTALAPFAGNIYGRIAAIKDALTIMPASSTAGATNREARIMAPSLLVTIAVLLLIAILAATWLYLAPDSRWLLLVVAPLLSVTFLVLIRQFAWKRL